MTTNKENIKEWSRSKEDEYFLKKFDIQMKKVHEDSHSNIHQKFNVTTMKFTINKEDNTNSRTHTMTEKKV